MCILCFIISLFFSNVDAHVERSTNSYRLQDSIPVYEGALTERVLEASGAGR